MSKVKVTLVKGINGRKPNHVATVKSLGLRKISQSAVHNKTADIEATEKPVPSLGITMWCALEGMLCSKGVLTKRC